MTLEEFYKATEDMPMDAEIKILYFDEYEVEYNSYAVVDISTNKYLNIISLY